MRRIRPAHVLTLACACLLLGAGPAAAADPPVLVAYHEYQKTGKLDPCKHPSSFFQQARKQIGNDSNQYSPDFKAALDDALQARASGACSKKKKSGGGAGAGARATTPPAGSGGTGGGTPAPAQPAAPSGAQPSAPAPAQAAAPTATPAPAPTVDPAPPVANDAIPAAATSAAAGRTSDNAPAPLILLAVLGALMLLAALAVGGVRFWAFDPPWLQRGRHATAEAGWRASSAWAEFADWVRLGR